MKRRLLRLLGWAAYTMALAMLFVASGYFSFSRFVRSGGTEVPDLVGRSESELTVVAAERGLEWQIREESGRYDDLVPAGHVLSQVPPSGSLVKRGATVKVVLSLGPQLMEVPDVRGKALQAAQVTLAAAGLSVGRTAGVQTVDSKPGSVHEQAPAAGQRVGKASQVDLYLSTSSKASTFLMPDLIYRDYDSVRGFFERRGFRMGSVKFEPYENLATGVVLRQFPLAGHPLRRQDVISLVVVSAPVDGVRG